MSDTSLHEKIIQAYQAELANANHLAINYKVLYEESQADVEAKSVELDTLRQELVNREYENEPEVITTVE